jgi:hypothetical protein
LAEQIIKISLLLVVCKFEIDPQTLCLINAKCKCYRRLVNLIDLFRQDEGGRVREAPMFVAHRGLEHPLRPHHRPLRHQRHRGRQPFG